MKRKYKSLIILSLLFIVLGCKEVFAEECPPKFEKINETTCIYREPAHQRNGVYYCVTGDLVGKDCVIYHYLENSDSGDLECKTGYENINGLCMKYIGPAKSAYGQYYCDYGKLVGANCYSLYDASEGNDSGSNDNQQSGQTTSKPNIDYENLCTANPGVKNAVRIVGYIIQVCRWLAPLIIIILGMIDFAKATISSDEKAINSAVKSLITRIILGIVIFIIPALVTALIDALGNVTNGIEYQGNTTFGACTRCLFDPFECKWQSKTGGTTGTTNSNNNGKFNEVYYE